MKKLLFVVLSLLLLGSCYKKAPVHEFNMDLVIPADSMVSLLVDLHMAEGTVSTLRSKELPVGKLSAEYFEIILKKHAISREVYSESIRYYAYNTQLFSEIYEKVITELGKKESLYRPSKEEGQLKE